MLGGNQEVKKESKAATSQGRNREKEGGVKTSNFQGNKKKRKRKVWKRGGQDEEECKGKGPVKAGLVVGYGNLQIGKGPEGKKYHWGQGRG